MIIDLTKPVKLIVKSPLLDRQGKKWQPGVYKPGELPDYFLTPNYVENVEEEPTEENDPPLEL